MTFPVPPPSIGPLFRFPGGRWCSIHRAIVYDSWLTWDHALPKADRENLDLCAAQVGNIAALARIVTRVHAGLSRFRPKDVPFRVQRWLDPSDPKWAHGRRCLISIECRRPEDWLPLLPADRVLSQARSERVAELLLLKPKPVHRSLLSGT